MSYIEKKYLDKINDIFEKELPSWEDYLLELLNKKSINVADNVAKVCADCNKNVNIILKQFYPEIKDMDEKLKIKSRLKFYFDLLDYLTDFIRKIENFNKISEEYYQTLIDFIKKKENLISGKYRDICKLELTSFYDKQVRDNLERILEEKLNLKHREFFTFGSLEEEIKKIAKNAGADIVKISKANESDRNSLLNSAYSVINYTNSSNSEEIINNIENRLKNYLESKGYKVKTIKSALLTDAKLLSDNP